MPSRLLESVGDILSDAETMAGLWSNQPIRASEGPVSTKIVTPLPLATLRLKLFKSVLFLVGNSFEVHTYFSPPLSLLKECEWLRFLSVFFSLSRLAPLIQLNYGARSY